MYPAMISWLHSELSEGTDKKTAEILDKYFVCFLAGESMDIIQERARDQEYSEAEEPKKILLSVVK